MAWLERDPAPPPEPAPAVVVAHATADRLANDRSTREVTGSGVVVRLLADDAAGDRHQRFILALPSGDTLLVVHNIDLAPRVAPLRVGVRSEFHREYAWNPKGDLRHWTHHDPTGRRAGGWLRRGGQAFR